MRRSNSLVSDLVAYNNGQKDAVEPTTIDDATKNRILMPCLTALCIGNMMMMNVASFLPTYVAGRTDWSDGTGPSSFDVTLILSIFSVA